uniref:Uncharacterized protein n=1 Tax=Cryptomonas curvata TaxID=233186 RepID=A0A7S0N2F3_9CRYP
MTMSSMELVEKFQKLENDVSEACINMELQRCKAEEATALGRAEYFHKSTQAWLQGRQKMSMLQARLPVGILTDEQTKNIFPPDGQANAAHKLPMEDLQSMRQRLHELRKILEAKVVIKLNEM